MSREIHKLLGPMSRRLRLMASRGTVSGVADGGKMQRAQVKLLAGEVRDNVERFQNFGFTSVPLDGAEGVFLSLNGSRDQGVLVVVDDRRYRMSDMQPGESAMHNHLGDFIHVKADRTIEVYAQEGVKASGRVVEVTAAELVKVSSTIVELIASEKVRADTPRLECTGHIVDHCDSSSPKSMADMRSAHDEHRHKENNVAGGLSDYPDVKA